MPRLRIEWKARGFALYRWGQCTDAHRAYGEIMSAADAQNLCHREDTLLAGLTVCIAPLAALTAISGRADGDCLGLAASEDVAACNCGPSSCKSKELPMTKIELRPMRAPAHRANVHFAQTDMHMRREMTAASKSDMLRQGPAN